MLDMRKMSAYTTAIPVLISTVDYYISGEIECQYLFLDKSAELAGATLENTGKDWISTRSIRSEFPSQRLSCGHRTSKRAQRSQHMPTSTGARRGVNNTEHRQHSDSLPAQVLHRHTAVGCAANRSNTHVTAVESARSDIDCGKFDSRTTKRGDGDHRHGLCRRPRPSEFALRFPEHSDTTPDLPGQRSPRRRTAAA